MNLEHTNITVQDIEKATQFIQTAFPEARVRGGGKKLSGGHWQHVGTDHAYIALQSEPTHSESNRQDYLDIGINHLGFVVEDLVSLKARLIEAGYQFNDMGVDEVGRTSIYFYDDSGIEWEFVEYHSDDLLVRNPY